MGVTPWLSQFIFHKLESSQAIKQSTMAESDQQIVDKVKAALDTAIGILNDKDGWKVEKEKDGATIKSKKNAESIDSSNMYNNNNEGIAIWIKIIAGIIVQIHSIICLSSRVMLINLLNNIKIIKYLTKEIINIKIKLIKSCKKINSSIIGELASCKPN